MSAETETTIANRLEYLRSQIRAECISWGELYELQTLASEIDEGDVELLEWAGVPERDEWEGWDEDAWDGSLPRTTVWANGFGIFHARVPRHAVAPLIAARRVLRDALVERYQDVDPRCWREPVRVKDLDSEDYIVYQERFVDIERTENDV